MDTVRTHAGHQQKSRTADHLAIDFHLAQSQPVPLKERKFRSSAFSRSSTRTRISPAGSRRQTESAALRSNGDNHGAGTSGRRSCCSKEARRNCRSLCGVFRAGSGVVSCESLLSRNSTLESTMSAVSGRGRHTMASARERQHSGATGCRFLPPARTTSRSPGSRNRTRTGGSGPRGLSPSS